MNKIRIVLIVIWCICGFCVFFSGQKDSLVTDILRKINERYDGEYHCKFEVFEIQRNNSRLLLNEGIVNHSGEYNFIQIGDFLNISDGDSYLLMNISERVATLGKVIRVGEYSKTEHSSFGISDIIDQIAEKGGTITDPIYVANEAIIEINFTRGSFTKMKISIDLNTFMMLKYELYYTSDYSSDIYGVEVKYHDTRLFLNPDDRLEILDIVTSIDKVAKLREKYSKYILQNQIH